MFYSLNTIDLHYYIYYAHWIKFWGSHLVTLLLHLMSYTDHLVYPNIYIFFYIFLIFLLLLYLSEIPIIAVIPVIVYTSINSHILKEFRLYTSLNFHCYITKQFKLGFLKKLIFEKLMLLN